MINGIYLKLGSFLANYDVKPLSKFGGNRKNRTNSTSHSLRYPGGYRFVRPVTKGLKGKCFFLARNQTKFTKMHKNRYKVYKSYILPFTQYPDLNTRKRRIGCVLTHACDRQCSDYHAHFPRKRTQFVSFTKR